MLKHWSRTLNTDCEVVAIGGHAVYPIFRVGSTSLRRAAERTYLNEQIQQCGHIDILIRDPEERFRSGLTEYCRQKGLQVHQTWQLVSDGKLTDRHFVPQYTWLLHLYKFYRGTVTLRPFSYIGKITDVHAHEQRSELSESSHIDVLKDYVEVDRHLLRLLDQPRGLGEIIKECRSALS